MSLLLLLTSAAPQDFAASPNLSGSGSLTLDPNNFAGIGTFSGDGALGAVVGPSLAASLAGSGNLAASAAPGPASTRSLSGQGTLVVQPGLIWNTFEGGTPGTAITTSNSGGASGTAITETYSPPTTATYTASKTARVASTVAGALAYTGTNIGTITLAFRINIQARVAARAYLVFGAVSAPTTESSDCVFNIMDAAGTTAAAIRVTTDGHLIAVSGNTATTVGTSTDTVTAGVVYRFEVAGTPGVSTTTGVVEWAAYLGDSLTPFWSGTATGVNTTTRAISQVRFGRDASNANYVSRTNTYDDLAVHTALPSGFIGPSVPPSSADFAASPTLTGSGALSPAGSIQSALTTALTGVGSLAPDATLTVPLAVAFSGSGALSGQVALAVPTTAGFSGAGSMATAGQPRAAGIAPLSGSGQLASVNSLIASSVPAFSGAGVIAVPPGKPGVAQAAQFTGGGAVAAGGVSVFVVSLQLAGSGVLTLTAAANAPTGAALSGAGVLAVPTTAPTVTVTVPLTGSGTLSRLTAVSTPGTAAFSGSGGLDSSATSSIPAAASLSGFGALSDITAPVVITDGSIAANAATAATATSGSVATVNLSGGGALAGSGLVNAAPMVGSSGTGVLASGVTSGGSGDASFSGAGALAPSRTITTKGTSAFTGWGFVAPGTNVRFNLHPNPRFTSPLTSANGSNSNWATVNQSVVTDSTVRPFPSGLSLKVVTNAAARSGVELSAPATLLRSGTNYTVSVYVQTGTPSNSLAVTLWGNTAQGANGLTMTTTSVGAVAGWTRYAATVQIASTAGNPSQLWLDISDTSGGTFWVAAPLYEQASAVGTYFDNSSGTSGNLTHGLAGTIYPGIQAEWVTPVPAVAVTAGFTGSGTIRPATVRTNLALNPDFAADTLNTVTVGSAGTSSVTRNTTVVHNGVASLALVANSATAPGRKWMVDPNLNFPAGTTITWTFWLYGTSSFPVQGYWEANLPTYTGGSGGGATTVQANTWTKITSTVTSTVPNGLDARNQVGFGFLPGAFASGLVGETVYLTEALIEISNSAGTYFTGSTADSGVLTHAWVGPPNASTSQEFKYAALPAPAATVPLSSDGALLTAATPRIPALPAFSGAGTLTWATTGSGAATPNLTGSGALIGSPTAAVPGLATLTGSGALITVGRSATAATPLLTGSGALTSTGASQARSVLPFGGSGVLTCTAAPSEPVTVALTGSGVLGGFGALQPTPQIALTGSGSTTVVTVRDVQQTVAVSGAGALTAASAVQVPRAATFSGSGALSAADTFQARQPAPLSGLGTLGVASAVSGTGNAALAGSGGLSVPSAAPRTLRSAILGGDGLLAATTTAVPFTDGFDRPDAATWGTAWDTATAAGTAASADPSVVDLSNNRGHLRAGSGYGSAYAIARGMTPIYDTDLRFSWTVPDLHHPAEPNEWYLTFMTNIDPGIAAADLMTYPGGYAPDCYVLEFGRDPWAAGYGNNTSEDYLYVLVRRYSGGVAHSLWGDTGMVRISAPIGDDSGHPLPGAVVQTRFQTLGSTVRFKVWADGSPEPTDWYHSGIDPLPHLPAGVFGINYSGAYEFTNDDTWVGHPEYLGELQSADLYLDNVDISPTAIPAGLSANADISAPLGAVVAPVGADATTRATVPLDAFLGVAAGTHAEAMVEITTTGQVGVHGAITVELSLPEGIGFNVGLSAIAAFQLNRDTRFAILDMYGNPLRIGATLPGDRIYAQGESKQVGASTAGLTVTMRGNPLKVNGQF